MTHDGLDKYDYWQIKPKMCVSGKDVKELQELYYIKDIIQKSKLLEDCFTGGLEQELEIFILVLINNTV